LKQVTEEYVVLKEIKSLAKVQKRAYLS